MSSGFGDLIQLFPCKKKDELDAIEVVRSPDAVRPIGLRNTDIKAINSVVAQCLASEVAQSSAITQNGFIRGSNFGNNIIEIDTEMRVLGSSAGYAQWLFLQTSATRSRLLPTPGFVAFLNQLRCLQH